MLTIAEAPIPAVIITAKTPFARTYHVGYFLVGQKTRKKKSAPNKVATNTQKTMVEIAADMRELWSTNAGVGEKGDSNVDWKRTLFLRDLYFEREYVAVHCGCRCVRHAIK